MQVTDVQWWKLKEKNSEDKRQTKRKTGKTFIKEMLNYWRKKLYDKLKLRRENRQEDKPWNKEKCEERKEKQIVRKYIEESNQAS